MKKVFASSSLFEITNVQNLLEAEGVATVVRNEHTGTMLPLGYLTEIELWVRDDANEAAARAIARNYVAQLEPDTAEAPAWFCRNCNESNPGNFAVCWNCGAVEEAAAETGRSSRRGS